MSKTAVIYWSGTGNTELMAKSIFDGVKENNPEAEIYNVSEITADKAKEYDILVLGCSAMGDEVLEEEEFEPFFANLEADISGKKVALFGSYGWGDGEWMRSWEERVTNANAVLIGGEGLIINETPDDDGIALCLNFGKNIK